MENTLNFSKGYNEYEHDIIFLPMTMVKEIGKIIKQNKIHGDREQLIYAVEKFIISAIEEKIQTHPKKKFWLDRAIHRLNLSLEKTMFGQLH
jgi:hypothetical protein